MPAYSATGTVYSIYPGDSVTVWSAETVTTGSKSQQVAIAPNFSSGAQMDISVDVTFSNTPGAVTVSLQTADTDVEGDYTIPSGAVLNSATAKVQNLQWHVKANFARLIMTTQPANSVTVTATISR